MKCEKCSKTGYDYDEQEGMTVETSCQLAMILCVSCLRDFQLFYNPYGEKLALLEAKKEFILEVASNSLIHDYAFLEAKLEETIRDYQMACRENQKAVLVWLKS